MDQHKLGKNEISQADNMDSPKNAFINAETLNSIIENEQIITHFQPVISLKSRLLIGFEALSRGLDAEGAKTIQPDILFASARRERKVVELDRLCRERAIRQFKHLQTNGQYGTSGLLFLNFDASLLDQGVAGSGFLQDQVSRQNIDPGRVVIEIVESRIRDVLALNRFVQYYRDQGFIIALDDFGKGYSNFDRIGIIRPDIIKIDRSLVQDIDRDHYKQEIFKALVRLSRKTGTLVLAEGVETLEECIYALDCDADLLQGFFFARPSLPEAISLTEIQHVAGYSADRFREYKISRVNTIKNQYRLHNEIIETMKAALSANPPESFADVLNAMIGRLPSIEAAYVLDENGVMVTDTVIRTGKKEKRANMLFREARKGDDLSLKEYFYLLDSAGLQNYVTDGYISWATGNPTRTLSVSFRGLSGKTHVLCIDVLADSLIE
jgi:EAL domain-containing protein (putative c-di-GMP-specific phosphodiesterase class I)